MKLCKDCAHFSGSNFCHAPQNGISPVDGKYKPKFATTARKEQSGCGPDANYWHENIVQTKPFWRFW